MIKIMIIYFLQRERKNQRIKSQIETLFDYFFSFLLLAILFVWALTLSSCTPILFLHETQEVPLTVRYQQSQFYLFIIFYLRTYPKSTRWIFSIISGNIKSHNLYLYWKECGTK